MTSEKLISYFIAWKANVLNREKMKIVFLQFGKKSFLATVKIKTIFLQLG